MYMDPAPNRNSPRAILLRESIRQGRKIIERTLANLPPPHFRVDSGWSRVGDHPLRAQKTYRATGSVNCNSYALQPEARAALSHIISPAGGKSEPRIPASLPASLRGPAYDTLLEVAGVGERCGPGGGYHGAAGASQRRTIKWTSASEAVPSISATTGCSPSAKSGTKTWN